MSIPKHHGRVFDEEPLVDLTQFPDRIAETFTGKTVFITGATGGVGSALIEKILRYTEVKRIYALVKSKRGEDPQTRFAKYFKDPFFVPLLKERPESSKKVQSIEGNLSEADLGISSENRKTLINEVDIIYHCGACVRFDEYIKRIILLNVRGTREMIALAKEIKQLQLFVHVSTTYCQPKEVPLDEGPSISPYNPHDIIKMVENMDDASLNILTPKLVGSYGNTYTLSKALGEAIVFENMEKLPIMVVRPSVILPCLQYPIPGYTNSVYGPLSFWVLYGKGLCHIANVTLNNDLEYIPLDMVINTMLITTYNYVNNTEQKVSVCNATNISWSVKDWVDRSTEVIGRCPPKPVLLFPWVVSTERPWVAFLLIFFTQLLPAALIDGVVKITGIKTPQKLIDIQRKMSRAMIITSYYYSCVKWCIKNDVIRTLRIDLNEREDTTYSLDVADIDMIKYGADCMGNIRRNVLFEKDEDLPKAKQLFEKFKIIHYIMKGCLMVMGLWLAYTTIIPLIITLLYYIMDV